MRDDEYRGEPRHERDLEWMRDDPRFSAEEAEWVIAIVKTIRERAVPDDGLPDEWPAGKPRPPD